ncbi:PorP/SprF family type IX secretion system membrane protein [Prevotella sp. MA2016]|uniref:PorP/SprF family type IX secretion system membrane protein n=1 Tax=Prevotella sp. MA2016 TaxID=1408310 RepID=UPI00048AE875|nr:PorP/SprF family type IX secretion system membrane protein [Prevotella sp. MA2016]
MKRFYLIIVCVWVATRVAAQYDASFAHYWAMETSFNPAAVGKQGKLNVTGAYALQMAGFEHNPKTMYAAADMPFYALGAVHGVGVQLLNDDIGLFSHKRLSVQYAYQRRVLGGKLSVGVQLGMLGETFDGSRAEFPDDGTDPVVGGQQMDGSALDVAAGLYYQARTWYAGVSVQHLNAPMVELGETSELSIDATYYFTAGYNIQLNHPFYKIQTSVLGRTDGTAWRADITGRIRYEHDKKMLYGGMTFSPTNSVTVLVGGRWHGIHLGYSYEIYTGGISPSNGSHELFVGYQTELNLYKKGRNLHKSVRLL